jgi:hypothetical protein
LGGYAIESWGDLKLVRKIQSIGTMVIRAYRHDNRGEPPDDAARLDDGQLGGGLSLASPVEKST